MTHHATIPGAEPWSATGSGERADTGVALIHGFTGNPNSMRPLAEAVNSDGYTVEMPLLPGHGTHWRDLAKTRYVDWRDEVDRALDRLHDRCQQVVLVGLSWGGALVLDVASRRPADVAGVAAVNAMVLNPRTLAARLNKVLLQYVIPGLPRDLAGAPTDDIAKPGADERAYPVLPARPAQSFLDELPRIRAQLADLDMPLLVAYSPQDHTVPAANSRAILDLVASEDVTEVVLERSYHVPTLDWDAEKLEEAVLAFIARVSGS